MIGQTLDHYRVIAQIGEGGMGVVYRARDEVLNRDVALKLLAHGALDKVSPGHLLREAQTASSLSHPNICTIHQVGETSNDFYVVMELIEGRSLSDLITATGLSMEIVTRYGTQIADALAHAHDRGIVHRDLKGSNVMVTPEGRVKVLDFGLATRLDRDEISELTLSYASLESKLVGTLPYMAPEVLRGQKGDHLSDLWSLGVLLYEAAAGKLPFRGNTGFEVTSAILREPPPPLPSTVPYGLAVVILGCLMKERAGRYQRASEVREALEAVQGAVLQSRHPSEETRVPRTLVLRGMEHLSVKNGEDVIAPNSCDFPSPSYLHCVRIEKLRDTLHLCDAVPAELCPNQLSLAAHNHLHPAGYLLPADVLSEAIVSSVERPFGQPGKVKDGVPQGLAGNGAAVDGGTAYHSVAFNHDGAFSQLRRIDGTLLPRRAASDD